MVYFTFHISHLTKYQHGNTLCLTVLWKTPFDPLKAYVNRKRGRYLSRKTVENHLKNARELKGLTSMASWHFLKHLTYTLGAHSTTVLSRRLIRSSSPALSISSSLTFFSKHRHKVSYHCPSHNNNIPIKFRIHTAASSSTALPDKASTPYLSVLIHCPKDNAVIT